MEQRKIDIETAVKLFMAISYVQENRLFDYYQFRNYLFESYEASEDYINQEEILDYEDELWRIIDAYLDDGLLSVIEEYDGLYRVNNCINFKYIIENNYDYYQDMIEFFYRYICQLKPNMFVLPQNKMNNKKKN